MTSSSRTPRRAPATRSCTSSRAGAATFTLDGETAHAPAGTLRLPAGPEHAPPRHEPTSPAPRCSPSAAGATARFQVSGWESRFRASTIREQDPQRARELYEEGLASDQDGQWAHYDLACWHALYGEAQEARRLLDRAIELGGDEVREHAAKDPDLESLR
jgi:hypothetical protein